MILVVGVSTNGAAYTPKQNGGETLDIEIQANTFDGRGIYISYIPIEEASSRVTIVIEMWQFGRLVENYNRRHFFWRNDQWGGAWVSSSRLLIGPYRVIVTFVGNEKETIRLYQLKRYADLSKGEVAYVGTKARVVYNMFRLPFYIIATLLTISLAKFAVWYRRGFTYRGEAFPLSSDGRYG
ncbi:MAG: hypothetical protein JSV27_02055 [Candidatus Bathyarchaeota archaeon]|nr:MAG: hypothetical protein JSV27_02055 [Candidatus Bathyarchaeota archaeon]